MPADISLSQECAKMSFETAKISTSLINLVIINKSDSLLAFIAKLSFII